MPHLQQLRDTMTWIGLTLLPLGLIVSAGRAFLAPTADGDSPGRVSSAAFLVAGVGLLLYDWAWGVVTELSHLLTNGLLGLPWVADGVERMLETLRDRRRDRLGGGGRVRRPAADLDRRHRRCSALLLVRVGLEVATALLYVLGGLVLGLSVTGFGRRLLVGVAGRCRRRSCCCRCCGRRCSRSARR